MDSLFPMGALWTFNQNSYQKIDTMYSNITEIINVKWHSKGHLYKIKKYVELSLYKCKINIY